MTIAATTRRAGPFATNGTQTEFAFAFKVFDPEDVAVSVTADGFDVVLVYGSEYTVELNEDQDSAPGGTVTTINTLDDSELSITSDMAYEQPVVITNGGGFYPRVFNDVFDRLVIYTQQLAEKVSRAALLPLGTPTPGRFLATAADGSFVYSLGTGADSGLREDLAASAGSALMAFVQDGEGATPRTVEARLRETVSLNDYEGTAVTRFKKAALRLSELGGGTLYVPNDSYSLDSAELAVPIVLTDNVTVEGSGSLLTITGVATPGSVFRAVNASNVTLRNFLCRGNSQAVVDASSGAFFNYLHDATGTSAENITLERIRLSNFKAERWVSVLNKHASLPVRGVRIRDVAGISEAGNNQGGASIGISSDVIFIYGENAEIIDVEIDGFYAEAFYIKTGITLFHKVRNARIRKPYITGAGQIGTADNKAAYAINIYGDVGEMSGVVIDQPIITDPRSAGIYIRGVDNVTIIAPTITGQTDVVIADLPKGAIAINAASGATIVDPALSDNAYDIMGSASTISVDFDLTVRGGSMIGASAAAVALNPAAGTGNPKGVQLLGCTVRAEGIALHVLNNNNGTDGRSFTDVTVDGGEWTSTGSHAIVLNPFGAAELVNYKIANCTVTAAGQGINADNAVAAATGDLTISNVRISDAGSSAMTHGIIAQGMPGLFISNVIIRDMGTGFATLTDGANGTIENLRTINVANGHSPNSLGMIAPTLAGQPGWFVQHLNPVEAGSAASKYVVTGWRYAGTWLQQRTLTGN